MNPDPYLLYCNALEPHVIDLRDHTARQMYMPIQLIGAAPQCAVACPVCGFRRTVTVPLALLEAAALAGPR